MNFSGIKGSHLIFLANLSPKFQQLTCLKLIKGRDSLQIADASVIVFQLDLPDVNNPVGCQPTCPGAPTDTLEKCVRGMEPALVFFLPG